VPRVCFPLQRARREAGMAPFVGPPRGRDGCATSAPDLALDLDAQLTALNPAVPGATAPNGETP
jgi:hypothetical protein